MIDMGKLQTIEEEFHRDLQCDNLQSQSLMKSNIPANIQHYSEEDLMLSIARIAAESGEASEVDSKLQTYPGMPDETIVHNAHPADRLLLIFLEQLNNADVSDRSVLTRDTISYLVDFCIHTRFHIVLIENNLIKNERFNQYPEFINRNNDREFVNYMRVRALNYLLLIAITNQFAKDALIALLQTLSEPHQGITLSTKEYFKLVKSLKTSIDLHKKFLESKLNSPLFNYEASISHTNLNEIELTIEEALQEL